MLRGKKHSIGGKREHSEGEAILDGVTRGDPSAECVTCAEAVMRKPLRKSIPDRRNGTCKGPEEE